jgi:ubiquinol-cytochrome c reductase cytochrome b subunit
VKNPQGIRGKIRARMSVAAQEQVAKPTAAEVKELERGHN